MIKLIKKILGVLLTFTLLTFLFDIKINSNSIDWNKINLKIDEEREKAMKFIQKALNSKNA